MSHLNNSWIPGLRAGSLALLLLCLPGAVVQAQESAAVQRFIDKGLEQIKNKDFDAAQETFQNILIIEPGNARAYYRLGHVHALKGDKKKAEEFYLKAIEKDPLNASYTLALGTLYEGQKKVKKAMAEYQRLIDTGSRDPEVREAEKRLSLASGKELANKGELNAALLIFNGLLLDYPDDPQVLFSVGGAYVLLNRVQEAEQTFSKLAELRPDSVLVHLNLANIYERTNRLKKARDEYGEIIRIDKSPKSTQQARLRHGVLKGRIHMQNKEYDKAIAAYDEVAALDPEKTEPLFNKALAYLNMGNTRRAEQLFLQIIKKTPNDFSARLNLGSYYGDTAQFEKAKQQFEYIIANDKGQYAAEAKRRLNIVHTKLADMALQSGDVQASLIEYQKALDYFSGNVKASFNRGRILIQQRKFAEARAEFENVVNQLPDNLPARVNLASIYEQLRMFTKAADQYEKILQIGPNSQQAQIAKRRWKVTKARGLWAEQRLTDAEKLLEEVVAEEPNNFEAYTYLGIIQQAKGRSRAAAESFQKVLNFRPNNQAVRLSLGQVYEQIGLDELALQEYRRILFGGATPALMQQAKARLDAVESRLSGFSRSLSYQFQYDDNLTMNDENPVEEIRSDLAFNVVFSQKLLEKWSVNFIWSPTYSTYHYSQIDYLRSDLNLRVVWGTPEDNIFGVYGRQDQQGLLNEETVSESENFTIGRSQKLFFPAVFGLTPQGFEGEEGIPTSVQSNAGVRRISSFGNIELDSVSVSLGLSASQNLRGGYSGTAGYTLGINRNIQNSEVISRTRVIDPRSGQPTDELVTTLFYDSRDYEYNSHTFNLSVAKTLAPGVRGSVGSRFIYTGYVNPDSSARVDGRLDTRDNMTLILNSTVNYQFIRDLSFFGTLTWMKNNSNLPVGLTLSESDETEQAIATFQSTSLGDYTRLSFVAGMRMNF